MAILSSLLVGCSTPPATVSQTGPSAAIPIAVWRLQVFNDSLTSPQSNLGCRMPDADIALVTNDLMAKARALSPNCVFTWNGNINSIFSPWITTRPQSYDATLLAIHFYYFDTGDGWNPDALNIYYVGDSQSTVNPYPSNVTIAATYDPAAANTAQILPHIFVNDQGYNSSFGCFPGESAAGLASSHTVPHEACHFLARFSNRCFVGANPNRCYSNSEHVPASAWNLMRANIPAPLVVQGDASDSASEKGEIFNRIFNSQWNSP